MFVIFCRVDMDTVIASLEYYGGLVPAVVGIGNLICIRTFRLNFDFLKLFFQASTSSTAAARSPT